MADPYSVLGIQRGASADEVKKAYRQLSRKYHPDANVNNPNKAQAEEKFKEVQEAYNHIMYEKEHGEGTYNRGRGTGSGGGAGASGGAYGNGGGAGYGYGDAYGPFGGFGGFGGAYGSGQQQRTQGTSSNYNDSARMREVITLINSGRYTEAMRILDGMPLSERNARWYYIHAHASYGMGNVVNATEDARQAVNMEPGNQEYINFLNQLQNSGNWYESAGASYGGRYRGASMSNCCTGLCCAEMLCNCCIGGGRCC